MWRGMLAAWLALAGSCGGGDEQSEQALRVQVFTGAYSSMPAHVAVEKGFFRQQGLEVALLPANSSAAAIAALIGGSMDIVESAPDLVMANIDKGIRLKYLMANERSNYVTLVVGSQVSLPEDDLDPAEVMRRLAGRRIGVNAIGATLHLAALLMLQEAGLSAADVDFVATGSAATTLSAWRAGAVDAQLTFAPVPELLETLGMARPVLVLADNGPPALRFRGLYSGWVTTDAFLARRQDKADAFIAAMAGAIDWLRDPANHQEVLALARRHAPVAGLSEARNAQVVDRMVRNYRRFWGHQISPEAIDRWNDYAMRFNLISRPIASDELLYAKAPQCRPAGAARQDAAKAPDAFSDDMPDVKTPDARSGGMPNIKAPNARSDDMPNVKAPDARSSGMLDVKTPNARSDDMPNVKTPNARSDGTPNVKTPNARSGGIPDVKTPDARSGGMPNVKTSNARSGGMSNVKTPNVRSDERPDVKTPDAHSDSLPDVNQPGRAEAGPCP